MLHTTAYLQTWTQELERKHRLHRSQLPLGSSRYPGVFFQVFVWGGAEHPLNACCKWPDHYPGPLIRVANEVVHCLGSSATRKYSDKGTRESALHWRLCSGRPGWTKISGKMSRTFVLYRQLQCAFFYYFNFTARHFWSWSICGCVSWLKVLILLSFPYI